MTAGESTPVTDRVNVLGVGISPINMEHALQRITKWVNERDHEYICVCTVHTIMECRRSKELRKIVNAGGMTTPDGMPLVWLARVDGHTHVNRVYGPDLMLAEIQDSARTGHRHFLYGGRPGVAQRLASALHAQFPGVQIVGALTPPVAPVERLCTPETAQLINRTEPDIVWVGISTPKQERWMARMRPVLNAAVLIGVGAAFDFHSGTVRQAPAWMQRSGLEWLFRLTQEPGRLWKRYLIDNPWFLAELALQRLGIRRFDF